MLELTWALWAEADAEQSMSEEKNIASGAERSAVFWDDTEKLRKSFGQVELQQEASVSVWRLHVCCLFETIASG